MVFLVTVGVTQFVAINVAQQLAFNQLVHWIRTHNDDVYRSLVENDPKLTKLELEELTDGDIEVLALALKRNTHVTEFQVTNPDMNRKGFLKLAKACERSKSIKRLVLVDTLLQQHPEEPLVSAPKFIHRLLAPNSTTLEELCFCNFSMEDCMLEELKERLKTTKLKRLELLGPVVLESSGLVFLFNALAYRPDHEDEMDAKNKRNPFQGNPFNSFNNGNNPFNNIGRPRQPEQQGPYLECLSLSGNTHVSAPLSCQALKRMLEFNTSLLELNLSGCRFDRDSIQLVAGGLEANRTLQCLDIRGNAINARGAEALAKVLRKNCTLLHLLLSGNTMGRKGTTILIQAVKDNSSLQTLHMSYDSRAFLGQEPLHRRRHLDFPVLSSSLSESSDDYGDDCGDEVVPIHAITQTLTVNKTLSNLDLSAFQLDSKELSEVFQALEDNTTLKHLKINHGQFSGEAFVEALAASVPYFKGLTTVDHDKDLWYCDASSLSQLVRALGESNRVLKSINICDTDSWELGSPKHRCIDQIRYCLGPLHRNVVAFLGDEVTQANLAMWPLILDRVNRETEFPAQNIFQYLRSDPALFLSRATKDE